VRLSNFVKKSENHCTLICSPATHSCGYICTVVYAVTHSWGDTLLPAPGAIYFYLLQELYVHRYPLLRIYNVTHPGDSYVLLPNPGAIYRFPLLGISTAANTRGYHSWGYSATQTWDYLHLITPGEDTVTHNWGTLLSTSGIVL
jgi:hypothetical protein